MNRGLGSVYQRKKRDKVTGERKVLPVYWIKYRAGSKVIRESSESTVKKHAVNLLKKRLGEIGSGRFIGPQAERVTFEDLSVLLVADYQANERKSLDRAERAIKRLKEFFGGMRALDISASVPAFIVERRGPEPKPGEEPKRGINAKPATIQHELSALSRMFTLAHRQGLLHEKPYIPRLQFQNARTGFFEDEAFRRVLGNLHQDLQPPVEFAYLTGWRRGEILTLRWSQVDFKAGTVRLEPGSTKNNEGRTFPFNVYPPLKALLERQRDRTKELERSKAQIIPLVFHRGGKEILDFYTAWRTACKDAGVPGGLYHDFRRTAVRNLERAGVPRSVAMKLTGHKTEAVYRRYAIVSESDLSAGVARLSGLIETQPEATGTLRAHSKGESE